MVINHIHNKYPRANLYLVGFSMGAIQAIRWLGEHKDQTVVKGLVSISCPIDISKASPYLSQKRNWLYAKYMTKPLIRLARSHEDLIKSKGIEIDYSEPPITVDQVQSCTTPVEFDTHFSIKVLGYKTLQEFYEKCSCYDSFKNINIPTMLILSKNDPCFQYSHITQTRLLSVA